MHFICLLSPRNAVWSVCGRRRLDTGKNMTLVLHQRKREGGRWQRAGRTGEACFFFGSADFENRPFREQRGRRNLNNNGAGGGAAADSVNAIRTSGVVAAAAASSTFAKLPTPRLQSLRPSDLPGGRKKCMSLSEKIFIACFLLLPRRSSRI